MQNKDIRNSRKAAKTRELISKNGLSVFYRNVDFLTVKLSAPPPGPPSSSFYRNAFFEDGEVSLSSDRSLSVLYGIVPNSDTYHLDFGGFVIRYFDTVANGRLKVLHVVDPLGQIVAVVHIEIPVEGKKSKNVSSDVEFVGLFWTAYEHFFEDFCDFFGIDVLQKNLCKRIDYCVDVSGIHSHDLLKLAYDKREVESQGELLKLSKAKRKKLKPAKIHALGGFVTWRKFKGSTNDLVIYDKRLDVLDKKKYTIVSVAMMEGLEADRPYKRYLDGDVPITRVEFRKRANSFRDLADNSIASVFKHVEQQMADFFGKHVDFDMQTFLSDCATFERHDSPVDDSEIIDHLSNGEIEKKAARYASLVFTHAKNLTDLKSETFLFRKLLSTYGQRLVDFVHEYEEADAFLEWPSEFSVSPEEFDSLCGSYAKTLYLRDYVPPRTREALERQRVFSQTP